MKKRLITGLQICTTFLYITSNIMAVEPDEKQNVSGVVGQIKAEMLEKGRTYTSIGSIAMANRYVSRREGVRSGVTNNQELQLYTSNVFRDNLAFNAGIYYDRTAWKPENGRDNIDKFREVTLGMTYGDQFRDNTGYYAGFNINAGLSTDKYFSYNSEIFDFEQRKSNSGALGFEIFFGILNRMYDNNNLYTRLNAEYDRFTYFYDNYNYTDAELFIEATNVAEIACGDLYCKRDDKGFPVVTDHHQQGTFIYDAMNPIWIGTGTERRAYDDGNVRKTGYFTAGFDYQLQYYPIDNIKVIGGAYANIYSENSKEDDSKYSSSDLGVIFGGGINAPTDDWLNNLSANLEFDVGRSGNKETDDEGEVSVSADLQMGIKAYIRIENPLTYNNKVFWYADLGMQRWGYSDTDSDYSYNSFGFYGEVGLSVPFTTTRGF